MSVRNYNHDMLAGINQLKQLRDSVAGQIEAEQAVSNKLKDEIAVLSERIIKPKLAQRYQAGDEINSKDSEC
ncbi:hypothetical protein ACHAXH_008648 [Discostella pseudostelligera]